MTRLDIPRPSTRAATTRRRRRPRSPVGAPAGLPLSGDDEPLQPALHHLPAHLRGARAAGRYELGAVHHDRRSVSEYRAGRAARGRRADDGQGPAADGPLSEGPRHLRAVQHQRHLADREKGQRADRGRAGRAPGVARCRRAGAFIAVRGKDISPGSSGMCGAFTRAAGREGMRSRGSRSGSPASRRRSTSCPPSSGWRTRSASARSTFSASSISTEGQGLARPDRRCSSGWSGRGAIPRARRRRWPPRSGSPSTPRARTEPGTSLKRDADEQPWSLCRRPWTLMYFTAHGRAIPCCIAPFSQRGYDSFTLGDATQQSLREIWNGPRYQDFRARPALRRSRRGLCHLRPALEPVTAARAPGPSRPSSRPSTRRGDRRGRRGHPGAGRRRGARRRWRHARRHGGARRAPRARGCSSRAAARLRPGVQAGIAARAAGGADPRSSSMATAATGPSRSRPASSRSRRRSGFRASARGSRARREPGSMASPQTSPGTWPAADPAHLRGALHRYVPFPRDPPRRARSTRHARGDLWLEPRDADAGRGSQGALPAEIAVGQRVAEVEPQRSRVTFARAFARPGSSPARSSSLRGLLPAEDGAGAEAVAAAPPVSGPGRRRTISGYVISRVLGLSYAARA